MNIILFSLLLILGFIGCRYNFSNKNTKVWFKVLYIACFLFCGISRVGHTQDISDLTHYVDYFENDITTYFEPGYLFFTQLIQLLLGQKGEYLVLGVGIFIASIVWLSTYMLEKYTKGVYKSNEIFFVFMMLFCIYWGLAFEAERIRVGMATTLLILSTAFLFCGFRYLSYVPALFAVVFQYTSIIFLPFIWILRKNIKLFSRKFYMSWLVYILIFDFIAIHFNVFNSLFIFRYLELLNFEQIDHYMEYEGQITGSYSLQYFWYHLAPLFFIKGDFKDRNFNKGVLMYFIGLSFSSFLQSIPAGHRIADFFEIMIVFPLVFIFMGKSVPITRYKQYFYIYIVIQAIMSARYLSISI